MRRSSLNQASDETNGVPNDWHEKLAHRGVTRDYKNTCYRVLFSVSGRQFFIGNASSQKRAAFAHDCALWKFLPKLHRRVEPNFVEDFAFITQEKIDRELPKLNAIYDMLPFLNAGDSDLSEDALREKVLLGTSKVEKRDKQYREATLQLKRARVVFSDWKNKLLKSRLSLSYLHKLPEVNNKFSEFDGLIQTLLEESEFLEGMLDKHGEYYHKVTLQQENQL